MGRYYRSSRIETTRCTIEKPSGGFCDADRAPGAPLTICTQHAVELYGWMHGMVTEVQGNHRKYPDIHDSAVQQVADAAYAKANTARHCVYYVQVGDLIKVGTTSQLRQRLANYPPGSRLLAVEPGGEAVETRRHRQFRRLLAQRKEWYHPGPDLLDHIAQTNRRHAVLMTSVAT